MKSTANKNGKIVVSVLFMILPHSSDLITDLLKLPIKYHVWQLRFNMLL